MTGSAIFNILLIPGVMGIVALLSSKTKNGEVSKRVLLRDGGWLLGVQILIWGFLYNGRFGGVESVVLLAIYTGYVYSLFRLNRHHPRPYKTHRKGVGAKINRLLAMGIVVLGVSCYFLVEGCVKLSETAGWGIAATALIVAAAATSLPDTLISVRDAVGGNHVEGVSNAFGSNIFDLCVALGLPVGLYVVANGPIEFSGPLQENLIQLWMCMIGLTLFAIGTLSLGKRLTWAGSAALLMAYLGFVVSVLMGVWGEMV